jgi:hypothetical protein
MRNACPFLIFLLSLCPFASFGKTEGNFSKLAITVSDLAAKPHGLASPDGRNFLHVMKDETVDCCWPYRVWLSHQGKRYALPFGAYTDA